MDLAQVNGCFDFLYSSRSGMIEYRVAATITTTAPTIASFPILSPVTKNT